MKIQILLISCSLKLLFLGGVCQAQGLKIEQTQDGYDLLYGLEEGYSYKVCGSSDLETWSHLESVRGDALFTWPVPASELVYNKRFFRFEKVTATGLEHLTSWHSYQLNSTGRFNIGLIGDSYTHARDRYSKKFKQIVTSEYGNLGAGYLGFAFVVGAGSNGSIDESELHYSYNSSSWNVQYGSGYGPEACHVISKTVNSQIEVQVLKEVQSMKLYYATKLGTNGFRYRIQGGVWSNVSTDAAVSLGILPIDLQGVQAPYNVEIETLGLGVVLCGVEAVVAGNGVVVNKLGATGKRAIHFMNNGLNRSSLDSLDLDMVIVMFGTNEQNANQTPSLFKSSLENIIDKLRLDHPSIDVVLILPCYTKYEVESPRAYKLQDYGGVMRQVAAEKDAAFLDLTEVFGPPDKLQKLIDSGLMKSDRIHPSVGLNSGGHLIAESIATSVLSLPN